MIGKETERTRRVELLKLVCDLYSSKYGLQKLEQILPVMTQDFAAAIHYLRYYDEIEQFLHTDTYVPFEDEGSS